MRRAHTQSDTLPCRGARASAAASIGNDVSDSISPARSQHVVDLRQHDPGIKVVTFAMWLKRAPFTIRLRTVRRSPARAGATGSSKIRVYLLFRVLLVHQDEMPSILAKIQSLYGAGGKDREDCVADSGSSW